MPGARRRRSSEFPGFYGQFGYATIGCDFAIEVETHVAEQVGGSHRLRAASADDLPAVAEMYNSVNAGLDGSVVRDPTDWIGLRHGSTILGTKGLWISEDAGGRSAGYVALREDASRAEVIDGGFTDRAVAPSLVAHAAAEAAQRRASTIRFELHPEFGLGSCVRRMECRLESVRPHDSGYMLRVLDQDAVLRAVEPALRARAEAYGTEAPAHLRVTTAFGTPTLELGGRGPERTLALPHERLAQLLFGYWSAAEVAEVEGVRIAPRDRAVAFSALSARRCLLLRAGQVLTRDVRTRALHWGRPYTRTAFSGPRCAQRAARREYAFQAVGHCEIAD